MQTSHSNRLLAGGLLLVLAMLLPMSVHAQEQAGSASVDVTVTYRERMALQEDAAVTAWLVDVSQADAPATVLAEQTITAGGQQPPFAFELAYDLAQIDESHTYLVHARIEAGEELLFIDSQQYPVLTQGNPNQAELVLTQVSGLEPQPIERGASLLVPMLVVLLGIVLAAVGVSQTR
jgi:putative lipoprotein